MFFQPRNRKISCCVLMRALALSDTMVLYNATHYWMVTVGIKRLLPEWECAYLVYTFQVSLKTIYSYLYCVDFFAAYNTSLGD